MAKIKNKVQTVEIVSPDIGKQVGKAIKYKHACNIRSGPGTKFNVVGTIQAGREYYVLAKQGNWRMIESDAHAIAWVGCKNYEGEVND